MFVLNVAMQEQIMNSFGSNYRFNTFMGPKEKIMKDMKSLLAGWLTGYYYFIIIVVLVWLLL